MAKKQSIKLEQADGLKCVIYLSPNYVGSKIITNLDDVRDIKFNAGEKIEITKDELKLIGDHRWLIQEEYNVD